MKRRELTDHHPKISYCFDFPSSANLPASAPVRNCSANRGTSTVVNSVGRSKKNGSDLSGGLSHLGKFPERSPHGGVIAAQLRSELLAVVGVPSVICGWKCYRWVVEDGGQ